MSGIRYANALPSVIIFIVKPSQMSDPSDFPGLCSFFAEIGAPENWMCR